MSIDELTQEDIALCLHDLMRLLSEWYWCASWLTGLEEDLWLGKDILQVDHERLMKLARASNSWWVWCDETRSTKRVSLEEWHELRERRA